MDLRIFLPQRRRPPSMGNNSKRDIWLIESSASCHMNPHMEWFFEYEKYNGRDVYLGDDSPTNIGRGRVKMKLKHGRIRTIYLKCYTFEI